MYVADGGLDLGIDSVLVMDGQKQSNLIYFFLNDVKRVLNRDPALFWTRVFAARIAKKCMGYYS